MRRQVQRKEQDHKPFQRLTDQGKTMKASEKVSTQICDAIPGVTPHLMGSVLSAAEYE
ncbi:hypothetical protein FHR87_003683 [Azomonas macrocytogenes]|uniref:Uncharacterized protein n=1 Tax=Azomonas macrocytogenes TaxID=69962 RepID=A0A839T834_AZOMA|nr:hypothetical protein [Azomonas macrocytogenes]